jgi:hypothetical protein
MDWWTGFFAGLTVGLVGGIFAAGLFHAAGDSDLEAELQYEKIIREKAEHEVKYYRRRMLELAARLGEKLYEQEKSK